MARVRLPLLPTALAALAISAACGGSPGPDLRSLQADPMSTVAVQGVSGEDREETARSFGTANDKSSPAMVLRSFRIDPGTDEARLVSALGDQARQSGWNVAASPSAVSGTRPMPGSEGSQTASLSVYVSSVGEPPVRHLLIVLRNPS